MFVNSVVELNVAIKKFWTEYFCIICIFCFNEFISFINQCINYRKFVSFKKCSSHF